MTNSKTKGGLNDLHRTRLVHPPFIAAIDVEATSLEKAIAIARRRPNQLLDAAEECNRRYSWDEFAAYDKEGSELLRILDEGARLREAGPDLLAACRLVVERWEKGDLAEAVRACASALETAEGKESARRSDDFRCVAGPGRNAWPGADSN